MSRNTSYSSSSSAKPRCPNCGNIIALTVESCPQCGFKQFFKAGQGVKEICYHCHGNGMATPGYPTNQGHCVTCSGRGFFFQYAIIDLRNNNTLPDIKVADVGDPKYHGITVQGILPVKTIHRSIAPQPVSSLNFIDLCFYTIIVSAVMYLIDLITSQ